jgi:MoaA/NifB/PqqE/SkfB family radical SAM enzyme
MKRLPLKKYTDTLKYYKANTSAGEGVYPFYSSFKITKKCGMRCPFCNVWKEKTPDLETKDILRIMDNLAESSTFVLCYEGGEPFMRKDIEEIMKHGYSMPYYTSVVTNGLLVDDGIMDKCYKYLDFLHMSIDEGHDNMYLYDRLHEFKKRWDIIFVVQVVVPQEHLPALEEKVRRIYEAKAKVCIMPACHLDNTDDMYPDPQAFKDEIIRLRKKYPRTIITASYFLYSINRPHSCTTASIIIDPDGTVYYPCRTLGEKEVNLLETPLRDYLVSDDAKQRRQMMKECNRDCGWYQYFAVSFSSWRTLGMEVRDISRRLI